MRNKYLIAIISVLLLTNVAIAQAEWTGQWYEPTASPPDNNRPRPINVSSDPQGKAGLLGLGLENPTARLHIEQSGDAWSDGLRVSNNGNTWDLVVGNSGGLWFGRNDSAKMVIDQNDNVGIGIDNPQYRLQVEGDVWALDGLYGLNGKSVCYADGTDNTGATCIGGLGGGGDLLSTLNAGADASTFTGPTYIGDDVAIGGDGTDTPDGRFDVRGGDIWIDDGATIRSRGRMHIDGEELLYILNDDGMVVSQSWGGTGNLIVEGDVGIGTWSPTQRLDVNGNVIANMYIDRQDSGYYLDPNGDSVLYGNIYYRGANNHRSDLPFQFLTEAGGSQQIRTGSILVSNNYSDASNVPSQGIWARGPIISGANGYVQVGNGTGAAYLSAGGDYNNLTTNTYYNGSSWQVPYGGSHHYTLVQQTGGNFHWYNGGYGTTPSWNSLMYLRGSDGYLHLEGTTNICVRVAYTTGTYYCPNQTYTVVSAQNYNTGRIQWPPPQTRGYIICCKYVDAAAGTP